MFKIVSDPTQYPIQSVDLSQADARANFMPAHKHKNRDITYNRPDGGTNVFARRKRTVFDINIARGISWDQYKELMRMQEAQTPVHLFPNFDENTSIWAPLNKSTYAMLADKSTRTLQKTAPTSERVAYDNYYTYDKYGNFVPNDTGKHRYIPSMLGNGISLNPNYENKIDSHPDATNTTWEILGGDPEFINEGWVTEEVSPVLDKGGCYKATTSPGYTMTIGHQLPADCGTDFDEHWTFSVWLKGRGQAKVGVNFTNPVASDLVYLTEEWTEHKVTINKDTDTQYGWVWVQMPAQVYQTVVYIGPSYFVRNVPYASKSYGDGTVPPIWWGDNDFTEEFSEYIQYEGNGNQWGNTEMTFSCCGIWPDTTAWGESSYDGDVRIFNSNNSSSDYNIVSIYAGTYVSLYYGDYHYSVSIDSADREAAQGKPYYFCSRVKVDESGVTIKLLLYINGKEYTNDFNVTDVAFLLGNDTSSDDYLIGGAESQCQTRAGIQHIRVDYRYWSDDEVTLHKKMFTDPIFSQLVEKTQGRKFRITANNLVPRAGSNEYFVGTISLEETTDDSDFILEL